MPKETWTLRNIYLYLVCLITLMMVIFATTNTVRTAVELIYPNPQSEIIYQYETPPGEAREMDEERLAEQREARRRADRRRSILELIGNGTLLLIAAPLYVYHWQKIERGREKEES
ncbi:MAG: hypothetical protein ACLFV5_11905 [Anaerolineales bacterium]